VAVIREFDSVLLAALTDGAIRDLRLSVRGALPYSLLQLGIDGPVYSFVSCDVRLVFCLVDFLLHERLPKKGGIGQIEPDCPRLIRTATISSYPHGRRALLLVPDLQVAYIQHLGTKKSRNLVESYGT
jgi:hypothetical protein